MSEYKFYYQDNEQFLQLHDNRTIWKINKDFKWEDYEFEVDLAILDMQNHFKDLIVYTLGRSGRHICVEDTPINRRRYKHLIKYAKEWEQQIINYFNNEYEYKEND